MLPKNWGHLWGQSPLKRAYSAPYKCNPNSAREIANALNVEADFDGNNAINADVDATHLLQAFANEGGGDYELPYSVLGREGSRAMLYVRREIKHGRKVRGKGRPSPFMVFLEAEIWQKHF